MKNSHFWPGFADLMTSLFFIMLALFAISFVQMKQQQQGYISDAEKYRKIQQIDTALQKLDQKYFVYDLQSKRYRMTIDVKFQPKSSEITDLSLSVRNELERAGHELSALMDQLKAEYPRINYLLVIEGNAQIAEMWDGKLNSEVIPLEGYELSYDRALSLSQFWKQHGVDFTQKENVEILLAGSGYYGKGRDLENEYNNRKFTIQITPKIGNFEDL